MLGLTEWQIGFFCLAAIVTARLIMAPYWAYQEVLALVPTAGSEQDKANTSLEVAYSYIVNDSAWGARRAGLDNIFEQARQTLIHAITITNELPAWGIVKSSHLFVAIPNEYWVHFTIASPSFSQHPYGAITTTKEPESMRGNPDAIIYHNMRVDRADILRIWPRASFTDNWFAYPSS